jgi:large subunit ribosomal protein L6
VSRIGKAPIPVPAGVQISIDGHEIVVKGPKGQLLRTFHPEMKVSLQDGQIIVERPSDLTQHRALHGLTRSLIANMVQGVDKGFEKTLEVAGVGYRVAKSGERLTLQLGFSHPIELIAPPGLEITNVESYTPTAANEWLSGRFTVRGIDKERVGEMAAKIRDIREVEPYKGKGMRYRGEHVRRKAGKAAGKGKK